MNVETSKWRRDSLEGDVLDVDVTDRRRKRRNLIIGFVAVIAAIALAFFAFGGGETPAPAPGAGGASAAPRVTVIVPGRQSVGRVINATGSLAARRDIPVGVVGEGGMVSRVNVDAGTWVNEGQVLATIERSVQTEQARQLAASIDVARAEAQLAQQELDRAQSLVSRGFISKADVDRRTATRDSARARVRVAQAQLAETQARIGRLDIRAPTSGLILDRNVEVGQVVGAGSGTLFRMAQAGEMELAARLSQQDLASVRVGMMATVRPVGSPQALTGRIWQVSPVIDPQTRQGEARILVPYDRLTVPGGFASAEINSGAVTAPLLPESAVQSDDQGNYVYIVDGNNVIVRRNVQVGEVSDAGVAIAGGLAGNERVVESAGAFLNPGDKVRPTRSATR